MGNQSEFFDGSLGGKSTRSRWRFNARSLQQKKERPNNTKNARRPPKPSGTYPRPGKGVNGESTNHA